ncbi:hypothetical protein E2C01_005820 [Portunus trituberculatus]|uniref:Uncharacterized protein n=1 Tax=Portunus trituberculatus TaxID=210409 RepID=A0A5B7CUF3_PORTR|nr:hypothetical protein [Portunus trituberculatus]
MSGGVQQARTPPPPRSTQVGSGGAAVVRAVTIETWTQKVGRLPPSRVYPPLRLLLSRSEDLHNPPRQSPSSPHG